MFNMKSSKSNTMNTKISDGSMSARRDGSGMSSNNDKSEDKLSKEEAVFDSGILSESDISQSYSAEVDSAYGLSAKYDRSTELRTQSPTSSLSGQYTLSEQLDSKDLQMGLSGLSITDSGVYSDYSDRLCDSAVKEYSVEHNRDCAKTTSMTKRTEEKSAEIKEHKSSSREDYMLRQIFSQDEDGDT